MDLEPPLIGSRSIPLDVTLALSGQGVRSGARAGERVLAAARQAVENASNLLEPRFIRAVAPIVRSTPRAVELPAAVLEGEMVTAALSGAAHVVAIVCTIGVALDRRVSSLLATDPLLALAFDGLGSGACERLAADLCREIEQEAASEGDRVTGPLSPGMIGWPLRQAQEQLFALVDPTPIGVVLTSSGQMIPRKTVSFVVGVGRRVKTQATCPVCGVRDRCQFRPDHA